MLAGAGELFTGILRIRRQRWPNYSGVGDIGFNTIERGWGWGGITFEQPIL